MQFKSIVLSFALLAAVCVVSAQNGPIVDGLVAQIKAQMDVNANPCQDFYQYACGKFLKENPIPKNASKNVPYLNWPAFDAVQDHVDKLLLEMVKQPWPYVNDFFLSCNQPASVYEQSFNATFREVFNNLEHADVSSITARMDLIFNLTKHQNAFLVIFPSDYFVMGVNPVGATLPYPEYVQKGDAYKQLLAEITQVFSKFENISQASKHAQEIVNIEEYVAKASYVAGQDYFITTIANATEQTKIDFEAYLSQYGLNVTGRSQLSFATGSFYYFRNLTRFVASIPDSTLRRYLQWQTYTELKTFNSTQRAWSKNPAKQEAACAQLTDQFLSDLVGMIFVEEVITDDIITSIRNMTIGIQNAFNGSLDALSWLDKQGLAAVRFKLQNIIQIIGHPNRIEKFSNLMTSTTNLFRNILNVQVVEFTYLLQSAYIPFNRSDDVFDPLIVNAFYNPLANTIDFPAAILESPIFSASWPKLFQYARLGYIVGHENTHGFDNEGSHFNAFGEEIDIFDKITRQKYDNSSKCIVDVYDKFIAYGNQTVNGTNTLGENIADIGGVKNSFRAYQNYVMKSGKEFLDGTLVPGLSTEQVFFLIFAQTTCAVTNEAWEEYIFENDVHAPNRYRTNGPISQSDAFATAYHCPVGSPMNPAKKCNLW